MWASIKERLRMDSKVVNKAIRDILRPFLKENGFTKFTGRDSWRVKKDTVEVINFQSFNSYNADILGVTTVSFGVNLGVYYNGINSIPFANKMNKEFPKEYECQARRSLLKNIDQEYSRPDIWLIEKNGSNIEECINDVRSVLQKMGIDWLNRFSDLNYALNAFREKEETFLHNSIAIEMIGGRPFSLARAETISGICKSLNKIQEAIDYFNKVRLNSFYKNKDIDFKSKINVLQLMLN